MTTPTHGWSGEAIPTFPPMAIAISQGLFAIVDVEDYRQLAQFSWYADVGKWGVYAKTDQIPGRPKMHCVIMQPQKGLVVHHKDHNGLNNQRNNLEVLTNSENMLRRKKWDAGVYYHKHTGKWVAEVTINYKKIYLGLYPNKIAALQARMTYLEERIK